MIDTVEFRKRVADSVEEENERLSNSRMIGMDEGLIADWFVVNLVERMERPDRMRFRRPEGLGVAG
jgi:hypothetical protein